MTHRLDSAEAIAAAAAMGDNGAASLARAQSVTALFQGMERIFASHEEPVRACNQLLRDVEGFFNFTRLDNIEDRAGRLPTVKAGLAGTARPEQVEAVTGAHYGGLFAGFSPSSYRDEPVRLLSERLERNGIPLAEIAGRRILDAGCGGGRYTIAWRLLGAAEVVGIDISAVNIATATQRLAEARIDGVRFMEGNVLALPFPAADFDLVFSNGVLHHTVDWRRGIDELLRVLKPGGLGWLYLIENPGGLFWEMIEIMRQIMANEEHRLAREILGLMGLPANRIFYMLDHVLAPVNLRLTPQEIEEALGDSGAVAVQRLARGTDFDRIERLHRGEPYASVKYGVGENRYIFSRR